MFKDKILLITGGTGSFGKAVLNRFIDSDLKEIRIFSRDEKKQDDMRHYYKLDKVKYYIGDVKDYKSVAYAMKGVDYVFHAAALKQVPSCEFYPMEAVKTNIIGTENVLNAAIDCDVKKIICLSTDKAVYPINAMGISKSMMEKVAIALSKNSSKTMIAITRYGNVMASRGSVIPLFLSQIKAGKELTVTDLNMTRFMMSLEQAVELVLFAFENGSNGDTFIQKSPASTIAQLVEVMSEIFNCSPKVKVIGTRHGEKLYETLLTREELIRSVDMGMYYKVSADSRDLNYNKYFSEGESGIASTEDYHSHNAQRLTNQELKNLLLSLEYIQNEL